MLLREPGMSLLAPPIWARGGAGGETEEPKGQWQSWKGLSLHPAGLRSTVVRSLCLDFPLASLWD